MAGAPAGSGLTYQVDQSGVPVKPEEAAQKLFYGIADCYCEANDLDLTREANAGRGPLDFKVSKGYKNRVVVETKLTSNSQLLHGYERQIQEYLKAEKAKHSVYIVINVTGGSEPRQKALQTLMESKAIEGSLLPHVVFVDAKPKTSASKY